MRRASILLLTLVATPAAGFSPPVAALPVTDRATADEFHAKLDRIASKAAIAFRQSAGAVKERIKALKAPRDSSSWSWDEVKKSIYKLTPRGRSLSTIDSYVGDLGDIVMRTFGDDASIDSLNGMMQSLKAITCEGPGPKADFVSAFSGALGDSVDLASLMNSGLNCFCADAWVWTTDEHKALFGKIKGLIAGASSDGADMGALIDQLAFAVRDAIPKIMGNAGTCSAACQTSLQEIMTQGLALAEAAELVTFPKSFTASVAADFVACKCGNVTETETQINDIFGFFGDSPFMMVSSLFGGDGSETDVLKAVEKLIMAGVNFVDYMFSPALLCSSTCLPALVGGTKLGMWGGTHGPIMSLVGSLLLDTELEPPQELLPNEAQITQVSESFAGCLCTMKKAKYATKILEYVGPVNLAADGLPDSGGGVVDMIEDIATTVMDGTAGSGGLCDSGHCPVFLGQYISMFAGIANWAFYKDWADAASPPPPNPPPSPSPSPLPPPPPPPPDGSIAVTDCSSVTDMQECQNAAYSAGCYWDSEAESSSGTEWGVCFTEPEIANGTKRLDEIYACPSSDKDENPECGHYMDVCKSWSCPSDRPCLPCNEATPSPPPASPPPEEKGAEVLFENKAASTLTIATITGNLPSCVCGYFDPANDGNIFPIIRKEVVAAATRGRNTQVEDAIGFFTDSFRAAKLCGSGACREVFDTLLAAIDELVYNEPGTGSATCTASNAETCILGSTCFPFVDRRASDQSYPDACKPCYTPTIPEPDQQFKPMSFIDDKRFDQTLFWSACFMAKDCPEPGVAAFEIETFITIDATIDTFGKEQQDKFIEGLIELMGALEGIITKNDVTLDISAGSLVVKATIKTYSPTVSEAAKTSINNIDVAAASSALGVSVTEVTKATTKTATFNPPSPPGDSPQMPRPKPPPKPPPSPVPPGETAPASGGGSPILFIAIGAGAAVAIIVIAAAIFCLGRKSAPAKPTYAS